MKKQFVKNFEENHSKLFQNKRETKTTEKKDQDDSLNMADDTFSDSGPV